MSGFRVGTMLVVGVGLIGGSFAMALKRAGAVERVIGYGRSRGNLERARQLGVIDELCESPVAGAAQADLVFLGVPVGAMAPVFEAIAPVLGANTVVTDGGSTKSRLLAEARASLGPAFGRFVPGHPIAGSERSGVEAATADLYRDHKVLLTPAADTDVDAVQLVRAAWTASGATVEIMDAEDHDRILGRTSHLPHMLAYGLVDYIAGCEDAERCFELAAGGFLDFTRIASSDPVMWRDICLDNRDQLARSLQQYIEKLEDMRQSVLQADASGLQTLFARARESRNRVLDRRKEGGR